MATDILNKIKLALRTSHDKLDDDILADIEACKADLKMHGIVHAGEDDPLIFNAIKLWCKSAYTDDPAKGSAFFQKYTAMRDHLKGAEGYGWKANEEADSDE